MNEEKLLKLITSNSKEFELLRAVKVSGSISKAAQTVGVTYRTAWEYVNRINKVFKEPMVITKTGGKTGGGTTLSDSGKIALEVMEALKIEINRIIGEFGERKLKEVIQFLRRVAVRTSARNQIFGRVNRVKKGEIVSSVSVETDGGEIICSLLTTESLETLGIEVGSECYALIKAPWIIVSKDRKVKLSARNVIPATVTNVKVGAVNSEVNMKTKKGLELTAIITNESQKELSLTEGDEVLAIFKASHVILGV